MASAKDRKPIHVSLNARLRERLDQCLEFEGLDLTQWVAMQAHRFIEHVEDKQEFQAWKQEKENYGE